MSPWDLFCYIVAFGGGIIAVVMIGLFIMGLVATAGGGK